MGPGPLENNVPFNPDDGNDGRSDDERDGWHIGYAVEMNGIGRLVDDIDDSSGSDDADDDEGDGDSDGDGRYTGYETLPSAPDCAQNDDEDTTTTVSHIPSSIQRQFNEARSDSSRVHLNASDLRIEHKPQPIELDEEKATIIKTAMSSFTLPTPSWLNGAPSDEQLKQIFHQICNKK